MDRLTQLQDAIDKLALLFFSSLDHLTKNAPLVQLNSDIPVVNTEHGLRPEQLQLSTQDLAQDIGRQAKQLEALVDHLPGISQTPEDQIRDLEQLAHENTVADQEYEEAVLEAKALARDVMLALRNIAEDQSHGGGY